MKQARDDDLRSSWTCTLPDAAQPPCAVGLSLRKRASVHGLRLFFAGFSAPGQRAARPQIVRIHTDAGWIEANLRRLSDRYVHLLFTPPVETTGVVVEVRSIKPARQGARTVALAEVDVLGTGSARRSPMSLDPKRAIIVTDAKRFWRGYRAANAWIEIVDGKASGRRRRLLQGTEVIGDASDRFVLVRGLRSASCACESSGYRAQKYRYTLVDRQARVFYDLRLKGDGLYVAKRDTGYTATLHRDCGMDGVTFLSHVSIDPKSGRVSRRRWRTTKEVKLRRAVLYKPAKPTGAQACKNKPAGFQRLARLFPVHRSARITHFNLPQWPLSSIR